MEDIYNDLENYDDVNSVKELRTENLELKQKLVECTNSMEMLQKSILQDFDKLSAEFKTLEVNYSSLLKIARAEIKRKTDMITNLNIEKDILVIKATQTAPPNKVQKLIRTVAAEAKRKKKKRNKAGSLKEQDEFNRKDCERPPSSETSSTATDSTNKMFSKESIIDNMKSNRIVTKENETHKSEVFPDSRGDGNSSPVSTLVDRRVSTLARPPFSKLSSDEEFEDMYSALEPKPISLKEPEKSRKRGRDRSQDARTYSGFGSQDKSSNYPDPFKERYIKNRTSRFSDSDRTINRDKQYNENDRNINRNKQYDNDRNLNRDKQYNDNDRNLNRDKYDLHCRKYSPERHRRGAREHGEDRYSQQYDRHRRLESPPRQRYQPRSRERRPHNDRERDEWKQDAHRYYPDMHTVRHRINDEYDVPQNKRPRVEQYPDDHDDRRQSDKHHVNEFYPTDVRERTCQSPDFSHTGNESSNEPIPEIRSTASTVLEDPRVTSKKYFKITDGNKEVLHTANANEIDLQTVNKSLWNLQVIEVPTPLKHKPVEISEELVDERDVNKAASVLSMASGELVSETTDSAVDAFSDRREVTESKPKNYKCENDNPKIEKRKHKIRSPTEKTFKDIGYKSGGVQKESKTRHKLAKIEKAESRKADKYTAMTFEDSNHCDNTENPSVLLSLNPVVNKSEKVENKCSAEESSTTTSKNSDQVRINTHCDNTEKLNILHSLIHGVSSIHKIPEGNETLKSINTEGKEPKKIADLKASNESEKETESSVSIFRDFEHRVYSTRHIVEGDLELSEDSNEEPPSKKVQMVQVKKKLKPKKKSYQDASKEKSVDLEDTTKKTRSKKDKEKAKAQNKFSELFGDNSSLITPEELNLATLEAHALPSDCCPPLCEDAQDGIKQIQKPVPMQTARVPSNVLESIESLMSSSVSDNLKTTKDCKNRTHNKKQRDTAVVLASNDMQKEPKEPLNEQVDSTGSRLVSEVKLVISNEKLKEMQSEKITTNINESDQSKPNEKSKEPVKSNKKPKSKHLKKLSTSESTEETNLRETSNSLEINSIKGLAVGDNKENASCDDNSEKNVSSEMARIFEDTVVSCKTTHVDNSKINEEKPQLNENSVTVSSTGVQHISNLAPAIDETGLVKTIVISSGVQSVDSNTVQYLPFNSLVSSTPAKGISVTNTSSEIQPKISQTTCVNVTIASEDSVSHSETDAPDIRINYYKRRRKVLKR